MTLIYHHIISQEKEQHLSFLNPRTGNSDFDTFETQELFAYKSNVPLIMIPIYTYFPRHHKAGTLHKQSTK